MSSFVSSIPIFTTPPYPDPQSTALYSVLWQDSTYIWEGTSHFRLSLHFRQKKHMLSRYDSPKHSWNDPALYVSYMLSLISLQSEQPFHPSQLRSPVHLYSSFCKNMVQTHYTIITFLFYLAALIEAFFGSFVWSFAFFLVWMAIGLSAPLFDFQFSHLISTSITQKKGEIALWMVRQVAYVITLTGLFIFFF